MKWVPARHIIMVCRVCFDCTSHVTRHTSHVTRHTSHVTRHTSHVTRHTSHVTRHTSHVTRHTSHVTGVSAIAFSLPLLNTLSSQMRGLSIGPYLTRSPVWRALSHHASHVTRHTSNVTRRTSHVTGHMLLYGRVLVSATLLAYSFRSDIAVAFKMKPKPLL
jgi:hypothetical protein